MLKKLFLLLIGLAAITQTVAQQSEEGTWQFDAIEKTTGESLFSIDKELDSLVLSGNRFHYSLLAKDTLVASGDYTRQNDLLVFFYEQPFDTIRRYRIETLNDSVFNFTENGVRYSFTQEIIQEKTESLALDTDQGVGLSLNSLWRGALGMFFL